MKYALILCLIVFASCNKEHLYVCHSSNSEKDGMVFYSDRAGIKETEERMGEISCEKIKDEPNCWECALYDSVSRVYADRPTFDTCGFNYTEMKAKLEHSQYSPTYRTQTCRLK